MRSGFTLVEILVAATIGTVVFSSALMIYGFANRSRNVSASARALQTALLVQERVEEDLARLVQMSGAPVRFFPKDPSRLAFVVYDASAGDAPGLVVPVRGVTYALDAPGGYLVRQVERTRESVGVSPLTTIAFLPFLSPTGPLVRVTMAVGREKGEPPGPDIHHAFLARIPTPRPHPSIRFETRSWFVEKDDEPGHQTLPRP